MSGILIKCSKCQSRMLDTFFPIKIRTGQRFKTCNSCRTPKHECPKCDKKFSSVGNLNKHIKSVHNNIRNYKCDLCEYSCSLKSNLDRHIESVHYKIKNYKCDICEYSCSTKSDLDKHIKQIHNKIKDNECNLCEYSCSTKSTLNKHIKQVHDKVKDYCCNLCEYKCSVKGDLDRHIKQIHDKVKDNICPNCQYKTSTKSRLNQHIKNSCSGSLNISSGEKICRDTLDLMLVDYECEVCDVKNEDDNWLRFDLKIYVGNKIGYIEYDGKQHYEPVCYGGISKTKALDNLRKTQLHDKIKDEWCKENRYHLLRIPYIKKSVIHELIDEFIIEIDAV